MHSINKPYAFPFPDFLCGVPYCMPFCDSRLFRHLKYRSIIHLCCTDHKLAPQNICVLACLAISFSFKHLRVVLIVLADNMHITSACQRGQLRSSRKVWPSFTMTIICTSTVVAWHATVCTPRVSFPHNK